MKKIKERFIDPIYYSLPVRLLILHLRKNQLLLLCWLLLFSVVMGSFGKNLGIPYLFLDPEYLGQVDFLSFFIVGATVGGFTMAYHITCYILDGPDFGFLGTLSRPFAKFAVNNGLIPLVFVIVYIVYIINFQLQNEYNAWVDIIYKVTGFLIGFMAMLIMLFVYFRLTNMDMFRYVATNVDKKLKKVRISRVRVMQNLKEARSTHRRVDTYLDLNLVARKAPVIRYDKEIVLRIFNQNHLNSVILESFIFILILALGTFRDHPAFQIPAAASGVLLLTIIIMIVGAITYWLRGWATTAILVGLFLLNVVVKYDWASVSYQAFGLDYGAEPTEYSLPNLYQINSTEHYLQDKQATIEILENWRNRVHISEGASTDKPKMVLICVSGGGLRSALWTMTALQAADSITQGKLMDHARLITGASGGLIGAAYFRELVLREKLKTRAPTPLVLASESAQPTISIYSPHYLEAIGKDNLNPIIFTLLVNDLFVRYQKFEYEGAFYTKDRGYAFEEQLNKNTEYVLDKKIADYREPEQQALIPMMLLTPAIVNDGRKLFISPQHVSYMNTGHVNPESPGRDKIKGIDFMRFFEGQKAGNLRFLTALRMNAAFPYVTPNVTLPTQPKIQIMDAGLTDNFGVSDAVRFMYVFKDWINDNTSGVVLLCIRDSQKNDPIARSSGSSLFQRMTAPFRFFYDNLFNTQDINNDDRMEYARTWLDVSLRSVELEYVSHQEEGIKFTGANQSKLIERPSLSWRLTGREKNSIIENINHPENQQALQELKLLLNID